MQLDQSIQKARENLKALIEEGEALDHELKKYRLLRAQ
jgi:hypothetical protein